MSLRSFLFVLPLLAVACAAPTQEPSIETVDDDLTAAKVYVRITGTCFQTYEMKALNTGASLGASRLVFKPGQEGKQFAFCAGTDRLVLRGSKAADGTFAVDDVWIQQSGSPLTADAEVVRAIRLETGESFERPVNAGATRRVTFQFGGQTLSTTTTAQLATGRVLFAGPRVGAAPAQGGYGGGGGGASSGTRRVDAVFTQMD